MKHTLIIIGIFLVALGATGGWTSANLSVQIQELGWQIAITIFGGLVAGLGFWGITKGNAISVSNRDKYLLSPYEIPGEEIKEKIQSSKSISVVGINLNRFIRNYHYSIEQFLDKGGVLRVIIVDPESPAVAMAGFRSASETSPNKQRERILDSVDLLTRRYFNYPNFELRFIDYLIPYSIVFLQENKDNLSGSYCYVRLLPFRSSTTNAPTIYPNSKKDFFWMNYFHDQFEELWKASVKKSE